MPVEYRRALAEMARPRRSESARRLGDRPRACGVEAATRANGLGPALDLGNSDGQDHGFLEFERATRYGRSGAREALARVRPAAAGGGAARSRPRAAWIAASPIATHRLPGQQPDPGLERPRLSRRLGRGRGQPALDQQFPGGDRPRLPGAVRGLLHAQHRRQPGHHQDHRMRDRRPRHRGRLDQARTAGAQDRQEGRHRRLRPGGPRLRPAARARRPRRARLREAGAKAGGLLRYGIPDFKMEKVHRRPPRRADGGGGRHLPLRRRMSASTSPADKLVDEHDAVRAGRRRREAARPRRSPGASSTASISPWTSCRSRTGASPASRRATSSRSSADGQARGGDRRRRHRLRLHRHLDPPGRGVGDATSRSCRSRRSTRTRR